MTQSAYGGASPMVMGVGYLEASLSIILVSLRLYAVFIGASRPKWDFAWAAAALVFAIAGQFFFTLVVLNGAGNHMKDLEFDHIQAIVKWMFAYVPFALVAATCAKFAVIALLIQHNPEGKHARIRRHVLFGIGFLTMATSIISAILAITACDPITKAYDFTSSGSCPRNHISVKFSYCQSALAVLSDIILGIWPVTIAWQPNTSLKLRVGLCTLVSLCVIPTTAATMRTIMVPQVMVAKDPTYELGKLLLWFNTEQWAILAVSAIPPLKPLWDKWFSKKEVAGATKSSSSTSLHKNTPTVEVLEFGHVNSSDMLTHEKGGLSGITAVSTVTCKSRQP